MNLQTLFNQLGKIENLLIGTKQVLNFDEVATYTGLSKSYLYKLTSTGQIPHYKPNGKICYFNKIEIDNWLQQNRVTPVNELETKATHYVSLKKDNRKKDEYELGAESIVNGIYPTKKIKGGKAI